MQAITKEESYSLPLIWHVQKFYHRFISFFNPKRDNSKLVKIAHKRQDELIGDIERQIFENLPDEIGKFDKLQAQVLLGLIGMYETIKNLPGYLIEIKQLVNEYNDLISIQTREISEMKTSVLSMNEKIDALQFENKELSDTLQSLMTFLQSELPKIPVELKTIRNEIDELKRASNNEHQTIQSGISTIQKQSKQTVAVLPQISDNVKSLNEQIADFQTASENESSSIKTELANLQHITETESQKVTTTLDKILQIITLGIYQPKKTSQSTKRIQNKKIPEEINRKKQHDFEEFYIPEPNQHGYFNIHLRTEKHIPGYTYFRLFYCDIADIALFELVNLPENIKNSLSNADRVINPACVILSKPKKAWSQIQTKSYGIATKEQNIWKVKQKTKLKII